MKSRQLILTLCLAAASSLDFAQGSAKPASLNQPLDVYLARFNALADQMDSPLNLSMKGIRPQKDSNGEVLVIPASRSVNVILKVNAGTGNIESIGGAFATDGGTQAALDAMAATLLLPMAAFNRPKAKGVGALSTRLCGEAIQSKGIEKFGLVDNAKIGCLAPATGGLLMKVSWK